MASVQNDRGFVWYGTGWEAHRPSSSFLSSSQWTSLLNTQNEEVKTILASLPWAVCRDGRAPEHRNTHCLVLQHMEQNNILSLGVATFTDKRQIPKLWGNAVQSLGKGKGRDEVQVQKEKNKLFSLLASSSFEVSADQLSGRLWWHVLSGNNLFCTFCSLFWPCTFLPTILPLCHHTIENMERLS